MTISESQSLEFPKSDVTTDAGVFLAPIHLTDVNKARLPRNTVAGPDDVTVKMLNEIPKAILFSNFVSHFAIWTST